MARSSRATARSKAMRLPAPSGRISRIRRMAPQLRVYPRRPLYPRKQRARCGKAVLDVGDSHPSGGKLVQRPSSRGGVECAPTRWSAKPLRPPSAVPRPEWPVAPWASQRISHLKPPQRRDDQLAGRQVEPVPARERAERPISGDLSDLSADRSVEIRTNPLAPRLTLISAGQLCSLDRTRW